MTWKFSVNNNTRIILLFSGLILLLATHPYFYAFGLACSALLLFWTKGGFVAFKNRLPQYIVENLKRSEITAQCGPLISEESPIIREIKTGTPYAGGTTVEYHHMHGTPF